MGKSLNDLDNATLHIDGQSTEVDAPPYIIDVVDEDDDIIDDEEAFLHDLANSDDEDLINVDDDGVDKAYSSKQMLHGPTAVTVAMRIIPLHTMYPPVAEVALLTEAKAKANESPIWAAGQQACCIPVIRPRTSCLRKSRIKKCFVLIRFKVRDKQTLMPLGDHAAHWSSYIRETQFDLRPHMESPEWTKIKAGILQHLQKAYNTNKAAFKAHHWVIDTQTRTYNVEKIRWERLEAITAEE
uniref:Uncharacterized protein n=1 Tax=Tanacetum cinerariifolium TaxID=118510 RepID=A0A6L2MUA8_TANCI|nr:hypothetical protein [Tanacetum cinerariifolium]